MALIVDAYNILHKWRGGPLAGDADDLLALARLIQKSRFGSGPVTLVCDGKPPPSASPDHSIAAAIRYSGPSRTADDVIEDLIAEHSAPRRLTVASSDRRLIAAAKRRGAVALDADTFLARIAADASMPRIHPLDRDESVDPGAVDQWMQSLDVPSDLMDIPAADLKPAPLPPPPAPTPVRPQAKGKQASKRPPDSEDDMIRRALEGLQPPEARPDDRDDLDMERWLKEGPKPPPL